MTAQLDQVYAAQRLRLNATVAAGAAATWAQMHADRQRAIDQIIHLVTVGQAHTVRLVDAYMAAKTLQATGRRVPITLDTSLYTIEALRGIAADKVYSRPFGAYGAFVNDGSQPADAIIAARASVSKLAATDLQLAHTHSARDWMQADSQQEGIRIVGYRRVLAGPGPHCALCQAAATRTYRIADLLPIHEHCTCGVEPLYGTEPVASVGTTVRVEEDPELGPRLMADTWKSVGPTLTL